MSDRATLVPKGGTTRSNGRFALLAGALLLVGGVAAARSFPLPTASRGPGAPASLDSLLRARCLGSAIAPGSTSSLTLHESRTTTWGFFLAGSAGGFRPGEPVLTWVVAPSWPAPSCLEAGDATPQGRAESAAAFWYRASSPGRYRLCLVGVGSGRIACGSLEIPLASLRSGAI